MRLRRHRARLYLGGSVALSIALAILGAACSDDSAIPIPLADPFADGGSGSPQATGSKNKVDAAPGSTDPDDAASSADCSAAPVLRPGSGASFFCPFLPRNTDASSVDCFNDQTCCNPGKDPATGKNPTSFCAKTPLDSKGSTDQSACAAQAGSFASSWPAAGGSSWECADGRNCNAGQVCCLFTADGIILPDKVNIGPDLNKAIPAACNAKQAFKYGGTHCSSGCNPDNEIQTCSTDDDCNGKHCVPFEVFPGGRDLGYCN